MQVYCKKTWFACLGQDMKFVLLLSDGREYYRGVMPGQLGAVPDVFDFHGMFFRDSGRYDNGSRVYYQCLVWRIEAENGKE